MSDVAFSHWDHVHVCGGTLFICDCLLPAYATAAWSKIASLVADLVKQRKYIGLQIMLVLVCFCPSVSEWMCVCDFQDATAASTEDPCWEASE